MLTALGERGMRRDGSSSTRAGPGSSECTPRNSARRTSCRSPPAIEPHERLRNSARANGSSPGRSPAETLAAPWPRLHFVRGGARSSERTSPIGRRAVYDLRHTLRCGGRRRIAPAYHRQFVGHTQARRRSATPISPTSAARGCEKIGTVIAGGGHAGAKIVAIKGQGELCRAVQTTSR